MEGAGADFQVQRLDQHAAALGPIGVEALDQLLERDGWKRGVALACDMGTERPQGKAR